MLSVLAKLEHLGFVPVAKVEDANDAEPLVGALKAGGLPCIEVVFRSAAAPEVLRRLGRDASVLLGAGTVRTLDQVKLALDAGAQFIVSPSVRPEILKYCIPRNVLAIPGICTPSELEMALDLGAPLLKFFPAEAYGGVGTLKALAAVFAEVKFFPTGGIDNRNLAAYLGVRQVSCCGGSAMVKDDLLRAKNFTEVTRLAQETMNLVAAARPPSKP